MQDSGQVAQRRVNLDRQLLHDYDALLDKHIPPGVLIDENRKVLHYFGNIADYLTPAKGRFEIELFQLKDDNLQVALAILLKSSGENGQCVVTRGISINLSNARYLVDLFVDPITYKKGATVHYHVYLERVRPVEGASLSDEIAVADSDRFDAIAYSRRRVDYLEAELLATQTSLQASMEKQQAAMEEFLATNEELTAANDESYKANEKLYLINSEFERNNREFKRLVVEHDNMLNSIDSGMIFLDRHLRIHRFNPAMVSFFTLLPQDIGRSIDDIAFHLADREPLQADIQHVLLTAVSIEKEVFSRDGKWLLIRIMPFRSETGQVDGVVITFTDISKTKDAEQTVKRLNDELTEANDGLEMRVVERTGELEKSRAELRSLAIALSLVEEKERRHLATELHDEIGQSLTLAKIKLDETSCARRSLACAKSMKEIGLLLGRTIQEVRSLTFQISPPLLYDVGFEAAVEWLAEQFEDKHRLRIAVSVDKAPQKLDEELSSTLYHVVRELLVNVVKHAQAEKVSIGLRRDLDNMEIVVADFGCGYDVSCPGKELAKLGGFGLFNIRQRIQHLGGDLGIESTIGSGTQVTINIPLARHRFAGTRAAI